MLAQSGSAPEEMSAFVSPALTMCFLCVSLAAHGWPVRTPAHKILIVPFELRTVAADEFEERQAPPVLIRWGIVLQNPNGRH